MAASRTDGVTNWQVSPQRRRRPRLAGEPCTNMPVVNQLFFLLEILPVVRCLTVVYGALARPEDVGDRPGGLGIAQVDVLPVLQSVAGAAAAAVREEPRLVGTGEEPHGAVALVALAAKL